MGSGITLKLSLGLENFFLKGPKSILVEIELLVEYDEVSKNTHFDTNFKFLACAVPKL